jgi:serine/threonine-protein kinase
MAAPEANPTSRDASLETDTLVGKVLMGRFTVLERIGAGGMGRVYKAMQAPLDRVCALKILNPSYSTEQDPAFAKRFFLEASVTSKLTHPNTITIFDYGRTDEGIFFIAMEYLQGRTLHQTIAAEGCLSAPRVVHIARQMCRALREAHALGLVHRDLKPANIMLLHHGDDEDFVKVLDFGLVKFFDRGMSPESPDEGELTQGGVFLGSPTYMAPEQARNQADPRSDVYSLGVVLYHMLAGRPPFQGKAPVDIILKHVNEPPPHFKPELKVPADLEAVVLRCLAKVPELRYQTMDELLEALKRLGTLSPSDLMFISSVNRTVSKSSGAVARTRSQSNLSPARATPPLPALRGSEPTPDDPRKKLPLPLMVVGGVLLAVGVGVGTVSAFRKPPAKPEPIAHVVPLPVPEPVKPEPVKPEPIKPEPPHGLMLHVESTPAGATVKLGSAVLGHTPLDATLDPSQATGVTKLLLQSPGFSDLTVDAAREGDSLVAQGTLQKLSDPKQSPKSTGKTSGTSGSTSGNTNKPNPNKPSGYKDDPYQ